MSLRILIVTHYWRPHRGGIETVAYEHAVRLARLGHDVSVLTSRIDPLPELERSEGIEIHRVRALNPLEKRGIPYPLFYPELAVKALILANRCDIVIVHSHTFVSSVAAAISARLRSKPVVVIQHNTLVDYVFPWNLVQSFADRTLGKLTFSLGRELLGVSGESANYVRSLAPRREVEVLRNGVDVRRFTPAESAGQKRSIRIRLGLPPDGFLVLAVRRLVFKNGLGTLVEAAKAMRAEKHLHFVVGGGGPDAAPLKDRIRHEELDNITLAGFLPDETLPDYYRAADLFVLPSLSGEGMPMVVLEAFASGLPVVATRTGGQVELVEEGVSGWLIPPGMVDPLTDAIRRAAADLGALARMSARARQVAKSMDWEVQVTQLLGRLQALSRPSSESSSASP